MSEENNNVETNNNTSKENNGRVSEVIEEVKNTFRNGD